MSYRLTLCIALVLALVLFPAAARAQSGLEVIVSTESDCANVTFTTTVLGGGASSFTLDWTFGDEEGTQEAGVAKFPHRTTHPYPAQGEYPWSLAVTGLDGLSGSAAGTVILAGPVVTLSSVPFPPLLSLADGKAIVRFTAHVEGDGGPFTYSWDLNGDGIPDDGADPNSNTASFPYAAAGKYLATVTVTDSCGFVGSDTLPVVVVDPEAEACHPMAQRIADAVNTLFPSQADSLYTCEEIFDYFTGGLTGSQLGFGRMWHAYKLAQTMEDLTWEEIRDWHLDGNGWGLLVQLDRFSEALGDIGLGDLVEMVISGEASVNDIRTAARSAVRFGTDFEDALGRLAEGTSPGELTRLYRTAQTLDVDPQALDAYLAAGMTLSEIQHAARLADRTGGDWSAIAEAHGAGASWGEIGQAQRLAGEDGDWQSILDIGLKEFRAQIREQQKEQRAQERSRGSDRQAERERDQQQDQKRNEVRQQDQHQRTAERLAGQYGVSALHVMDLYDGVCAGDWSCVRAQLRGSTGGRPEGKGKDK